MLVDFWFNHFNVDMTKNAGRIPVPNLGHLLIGSYERDAIRAHVLGHFKDLLLATARHPAMLYYLDNWESTAPNAFEVGPYAPRRGFLNGVANAIITPDLFHQNRLLLASEKFLAVEGILQNQDNVISVKAERVSPLFVTQAETASHDFH